MSWSFIVLMIDVLLVFCYFIIVRGVDLEKPTGANLQKAPSAENETFWLMVIFILYLLWDVVTKAVISDPGREKFFRRIFGKEFWERGWVSVVCAILSYLAWVELHTLSKPQNVSLADASLLSLVFLFRGMKEKKWLATVICFSGFFAFLIIATHT